jgi:MFS family permease
VFLRVWVLTAVVVAVGYGQFHSGFPAYATGPNGITPGVLGIAFAANTFTVVSAQLVVLRLMTNARRTRAIVIACSCWATTWALTLLAGQLGGHLAAALLFILAMIVFALAETFFSLTSTAIVNDLASDELRSRYNGLSTLAWTTGFLTGPALAGFALDD